MKYIIILIIQLYVYSSDILILNSYSSTLKWTNEQSSSILNTLSSDKNNIYVEYMDTKRFKPTLKYKQDYIEFLKKKYSGIAFDVIITTDDNAINFVNRYLNVDIIKKAKIFFTGVNNLHLANILEKNKFLGVFEEKEPILNYKLSKKINNKLKIIYIIGDNSYTSNEEIQNYKNKLKEINDVKIKYLNSNNLEDILNSLKDYENDSVIFMMAFTSFKYQNNNIDSQNVIKLISKNYTQAILVHTNIYACIKDSNIIGGYCSNGVKAGHIVAKFAENYLSNKNMDNLKCEVKVSNNLYLNEKNIKKLGIDIDDLKTNNSIIVNPNNSIYEKYKLYINIVFIFIILNIYFLFIVMKKNKELKISKNELMLVNKYLKYDIEKAVKKSLVKERQLNRKSKLESMGEMIINISHQWRQPLSLISTISSAMVLKNEMGLMTKELIAEECTKINTKVQTLSKTIDTFTNFINDNDEKENINLNKNVLVFLDLVKNTIELNKINIEINVDKDIEIEGYANGIIQTYINMFNNSVDAFKINNIEHKYIKININKFDKNIHIDFHDNAGGISDEAINKLYEPYFTTYHQSEGKGLGLNYVYNFIVNICEGTIKAKNENLIYNNVEYKGAVFEIIINS